MIFEVSFVFGFGAALAMIWRASGPTQSATDIDVMRLRAENDRLRAEIARLNPPVPDSIDYRTPASLPVFERRDGRSMTHGRPVPSSGVDRLGEITIPQVTIPSTPTIPPVRRPPPPPVCVAGPGRKVLM